jgi:hypothetical protein
VDGVLWYTECNCISVCHHVMDRDNFTYVDVCIMTTQ